MTDTPTDPRSQRRQAVSDLKRQMILDAAERIFQQDGLDGAHMRAIAKEAGYTVSALYKYYASKEEIYADLLAASLDRLHAAVEGAAPPTRRRSSACAAGPAASSTSTWPTPGSWTWASIFSAACSPSASTRNWTPA
jgi:AcrR family transcriptional regulator